MNATAELYLPKVSNAPDFYGKKVYSVSTSVCAINAIHGFKVYDCSNTGKNRIKYKPTYLTFRNSWGGEMNKLYKVADLIILNFSEDLETFLEDASVNSNYKERVTNYVDYMLGNGIWKKGLPDDERQLFFLSGNSIELNNRPKPQKNSSQSTYYELTELLSNDIV